jgi:hypothetical protein
MFDEPGAVQTTELAGTATFIDDPTPRVMISGDGRWIVFDSRAALNYPLDIVTTDTNNESDVIVMDVATFTPRRMSVSTQGAQSDFASCDDHCFNSLSSISRDGRFVTFTSAADNLGTSSFLFQLLVRDRDPDGNGVFDERGAITIETSPSLGKPASLGGIMSPDGRFIPRLGDGLRIYDQATRLHDAPLPGADWFPTVLAERGRFAVGGRDTIRVRGIDTSPAATVAVDRNADGDAFDTLLGLVNTVALSPTVEWLGAAGQVEVADGNAVFLLPEVEDSAGPDLNQDGDDDDSFVRLYRKGQGVANLGRAARRVAITEHWIA